VGDKMRRAYRSYQELLQHEQEGQDFSITAVLRDSALAIIAPHGGGIEPGTSELAYALAGDRYSFYCFEGLKRMNSRQLHIASTLFDEPQCLDLVRQSRLVIAVHGCQGLRPRIDVGGRYEKIKLRLVSVLSNAGFPAILDETSHAGIEPANICNRCTGGQGVQLEISFGLRKLFFGGMTHRQRSQTTPLFSAFISTMKDLIGSLGISETREVGLSPITGNPNEPSDF
jgi:phage replication-related protein YjqB (UPF0714/DUF867 family)